MATSATAAVHDLTGLTVFSSSNESVATVSADGLVEKTGRGETAILARLLDKMSTGSITFLEDVKGFAWTNPPANNFVDTLVYEKLKQLQILPSDVCSDEEFVRRAYLDADGRLPRPEETLAFLSSHDANKRGKLVDDLVDSADCAAFWTLKWCDVLRANSKKLEPAGVHKFRRWVYESVLADKPVDQFARELLTSKGAFSRTRPPITGAPAAIRRTPPKRRPSCSWAFASSARSATTIRSSAGRRTTTTASPPPSLASAVGRVATRRKKKLSSARMPAKFSSRGPGRR